MKTFLLRARGALSVLTAPLWFLPAVITQAYRHSVGARRYLVEDLVFGLRGLGYHFQDAWNDRALCLRAAYSAQVAEPARAASKATFRAFRNQVLLRLVALGFLVVSPIVILWAIIETLREEGFFGDIAEVYADVLRAIVFAEQPR